MNGWEVTIDDVMIATKQMGLDLTSEQCDKIHDYLDFGDIDKAVFHETDFDEQTSAMYEEIKKQIPDIMKEISEE